MDKAVIGGDHTYEEAQARAFAFVWRVLEFTEVCVDLPMCA
jgi:hypothetical protein